ncbi:MAG TPA: hypothetical protein VFB03_02530 [Candidatus Saccharimonadales bacterium]|nr:hypothetical protein [Candidatus Saccharimonadales bacterium]
MINTKEIQGAVASGEGIDILPAEHSLEMGAHTLPVSESVVVLDRTHQICIEGILRRSLQLFPRESTRIQETLEVPTAFARLDCSIGPEGVLAYECEERPAGFGIQELIERRHNEQGIRDRLQQHSMATLGSELVAVHHPDALPNDDHLALDVVSLASLNGHAVIARGEPHMFTDEADYRRLASASISTIRSEGDKTYSLQVDEFGAETISDVDELPPKEESFVLKNTQGSKCRGVSIYLSKADQKKYGKKGIVTYTRMQNRLLENPTPHILDKFKPPISVNGIGNMALRVLAFVHADRVEVIGGVYVVRPELLVHGASNAVAGLVALEKTGVE